MTPLSGMGQSVSGVALPLGCVPARPHAWKGSALPINFPSLDADGRPIEVTYYTVDEASIRLHVSRHTLRARLRRGAWPHLFISGRYYLSDAHLARVVEMLTVDPDEIGMSWRADERSLGVVVDADIAEGGVS